MKSFATFLFASVFICCALGIPPQFLRTPLSWTDAGSYTANGTIYSSTLYVNGTTEPVLNLPAYLAFDTVNHRIRIDDYINYWIFEDSAYAVIPFAGSQCWVLNTNYSTYLFRHGQAKFFGTSINFETDDIRQEYFGLVQDGLTCSLPWSMRARKIPNGVVTSYGYQQPFGAAPSAVQSTGNVEYSHFTYGVPPAGVYELPPSCDTPLPNELYCSLFYPDCFDFYNQ